MTGFTSRSGPNWIASTRGPDGAAAAPLASTRPSPRAARNARTVVKIVSGQGSGDASRRKRSGTPGIPDEAPPRSRRCRARRARARIRGRADDDRARRAAAREPRRSPQRHAAVQHGRPALARLRARRRSATRTLDGALERVDAGGRRRPHPARLAPRRSRLDRRRDRDPLPDAAAT